MGRSARPAGLPAVLLTLAVAMSACASDPGTRPVAATTDDGWHGVALDEPYRVDGAVLTDTDGRPYSLTRDTDAPVTLVFFGYTHCPDICQLVMSTLAAARLRLSAAERDQVDVVLVTTDPARDDERTLRAYLDRFDPAFVGLTGDLSTIERVAGALAVSLNQGRRLASGGYEVEHNDHVLAVTRDDLVPLLWMRDASAADVADDLRRLLRQEEES